MIKQAGRIAGRQRDGAEQAVPVVESVVSVPWAPRTDGLQAILVNQRATVFDRPAEVPAAAVNPVAEIADPIWDHHDGKVWTPDLVHCRLLNVGDTITRLPSPVRRGFVSLLGDAALADRDRVIRTPPTAVEITVADWTWSELLKRPGTQRAVLQAMAFGLSVRKVAQLLQKRQASAPGKSSIANLYLSERRYLAAIWQGERQLVDDQTWERWRALFQKAEN